MRVGVTGGSGVLGQRIAQKLRNLDHEVSVFTGDVTDRSQVERWTSGRFDDILHCAAVVPVDRVNEAPDIALATNVLGTVNIAVASRRPERAHITYISSSHVYQPKKQPIQENDYLQPTTLYGLTKLQAEQWLQQLAPQFLIIRVFSFFAFDQPDSFLVPALMKTISETPKNGTILVRNAGVSRDIADADWVAEVCANLVSLRASGIVNCGTGKGHSIIAIAQLLAKVMNRNDLKWRHLVEDGVNDLIADTTFLKDLLGKLPPFALRPGLARFVSQRNVTAESHV